MEEINPKFEVTSIGVVKRISTEENERDRQLIAKIIIKEDLTPALNGIDEWSHIYIIFWLDRNSNKAETKIYHHKNGAGIFAARSPIHPNPIGLTLVELVKRENNVLWVKGIDAFDGTPVLDIKPYPDWEKGQLKVITDFRIPEWLRELQK